jgi:lysozyme
MQLSDQGVEFIARFEGFSATLYDDPAGHCTIGYGHLVHTGACNGSEPERFKRGITKKQGLRLLRKDAASAAGTVGDKVTVPLNQEQFDALVDFVFNLGAGNFSSSTLLKKLNQGQYSEVPSELDRWVFAGGKVLPGLVKRRKAEGTLFSTGDYGA